MMTNRLQLLPTVAAATIAVLVVAACAIRLRGDESETGCPASRAPKSDQMAGKLEHCRTVKYDQKDALLECQKIWAERRRQFLGQKPESPTHPDAGAATAGSPSPVPPKDDSRLPSTSPSIPAQRD